MEKLYYYVWAKWDDGCIGGDFLEALSEQTNIASRIAMFKNMAQSETRDVKINPADELKLIASIELDDTNQLFGDELDYAGSNDRCLFKFTVLGDLKQTSIVVGELFSFLGIEILRASEEITCQDVQVQLDSELAVEVTKQILQLLNAIEINATQEELSIHAYNLSVIKADNWHSDSSLIYACKKLSISTEITEQIVKITPQAFFSEDVDENYLYSHLKS